jgi:hypothetical protein
MKKVLVYYRSNCNDGKGAALAAWLHFNDDAVYKPIGYFDPFPDINEFTDKDVYILDFSFEPADLAKIAEHARSVTMITRRDLTNLKKSPIPSLQSCNIIIDPSKSGSVLTWEHFFGDKALPDLFVYLQDYDLWKHDYVESKYVIQALYSEQQFSFQKWNQFLEEDMPLQELILKGQILYDHELNMAYSFLKKSWSLQVLDKNPLHLLTVVNAPLRLVSKLGEAHRATKAAGPILTYQAFEKKCSISLRNGCSSIDLGALAQKLAYINECRGGGHFGAAGLSPKCHFHEMVWE